MYPRFSTTHQLTELEFQAFARPKLVELYGEFGRSLLTSPFANLEMPRLLLYHYWFPENGFKNALEKCSKENGDDGLFLTAVGDIDSGIPDDARHWYIKFRDLSDFEMIFPPLDHIVYSTMGDWAVVSSVESFGFFTCSQKCLHMFEEEVPDLHLQVSKFLADHVEDNLPDSKLHPMPIGWISATLKHLYGDKKAKQLLVDSGLFRFLNS